MCLQNSNKLDHTCHVLILNEHQKFNLLNFNETLKMFFQFRSCFKNLEIVFNKLPSFVFDVFGIEINVSEIFQLFSDQSFYLITHFYNQIFPVSLLVVWERCLLALIQILFFFGHHLDIFHQVSTNVDDLKVELLYFILYIANLKNSYCSFANTMEHTLSINDFMSFY